MARKAKHATSPTPEANLAEQEALGKLTPRELTKQEFGRRLSVLLADKGMNQSDLARAAGIGRDAISTYVRGRSFPEPRNLKKISEALGIERNKLLPNAAKQAIESEIPAFEMKQAAGHPEQVWLRVNQMVNSDKAFRIFQILMED